MQRCPMCSPKLSRPWAQPQNQPTRLKPRNSSIFAKLKMPSVSNNDSLTSNFYSAYLMEDGGRVRVKRCKSSRQPMVLATPTPGTKLHKSACLQHRMPRQPRHLTSVSLAHGALTLLNVVSRLSR